MRVTFIRCTKSQVSLLLLVNTGHYSLTGIFGKLLQALFFYQYFFYLKTFKNCIWEVEREKLSCAHNDWGLERVKAKAENSVQYFCMVTETHWFGTHSCLVWISRKLEAGSRDRTEPCCPVWDMAVSNPPLNAPSQYLILQHYFYNSSQRGIVK